MLPSKHILLTIITILISGLFIHTYGQTEIETWEDLYNIREDLSGDYILMNDLDPETDGYSQFVKDGEELADGGQGWSPIGDLSTPFTGMLRSANGNTFTISGLELNRGTQQHVGLFGAIDGAEFEDFTISDAQITAVGGSERVSGISIFAGHGQNFSISNMTIHGEIQASSELFDAEDSDNKAAISSIGGVVAEVPTADDSEITLTDLTVDIDIEITSRRTNTSLGFNEGIDATDIGGIAGRVGELFSNLQTPKMTINNLTVNGTVNVDTDGFAGRISNTFGGVYVDSSTDSEDFIWNLDNITVEAEMEIQAIKAEDSGLLGGLIQTIWHVNNLTLHGEVEFNSNECNTDDLVLRPISFCDTQHIAVGVGHGANSWEIDDADVTGALIFSSGRNMNNNGVFAGRTQSEWKVTNSSFAGTITGSADRDPDSIAILAGRAGASWEVDNVTVDGNITISAERNTDAIGILTGQSGTNWNVSNTTLTGNITLTPEIHADETGFFAGDAGLGWTIDESSASGNITINAGGRARNIGIFAGETNRSWTVTNSWVDGNIDLETVNNAEGISLFAANPGYGWSVSDINVKGDITIQADERARQIGGIAGNAQMSAWWDLTDVEVESNINITTTNDEILDIGLLAGTTDAEWEIENIFVKGNLNLISGSSLTNTALLVGASRGGNEAVDVIANGNIMINAESDVFQVALFAGHSQGSWDMEKSYAMGDITIAAGGDLYTIGSLFGNISDGSEDFSLSEVFASGDITVSTTASPSPDFGEIGGLIGEVADFGTNSFSLSDSYFYGDLNADGAGSVGGLIGYAAGGTTISNSYAAGVFTGDSNTGGLIGLEAGDISIENSFFDQALSPGMHDENDYGTDTEAMKMASIFTDAGWDFDDPGGVWQIESGEYVSYPYLQSFEYDEPGAEPPVNPIPGLDISTEIRPDDDNIIYVNQSVEDGLETGDSWANALPELRDALDWAQDWDAEEDDELQIWVAEGVYTPVEVDDPDEVTTEEREATFRLVNGVEVYGGFDGTETSLEQRNWVANETTLSGDINGSGELAGNSYSVVTGSGTDATAVIDGFTITMGNADVTSGSTSNPDRSGGGMYNTGGSPTVTNSTFSGNSADRWGGGMYNFDRSSPTVTNSTFSGNTAGAGGGMVNWGSSSPTVTNSTFSGNSAGSVGGGMVNDFSSPTVTNSTFSGNSAGNNGGGMVNEFSSPTITNSTFSGNSANSRGGGMFNFDNSSPTVTNSTFSGNSAGIDGGGMFNDLDSSPTVTNSIIWNNSADGSTDTPSASVFNDDSTLEFSYSLIANSGGSDSWVSAIGTDGGNNLDADPLFVETPDPEDAPTSDGNLRLTALSPAINAGDPDTDLSIFPGGPDNPVDLDGNPRVFNGTVQQIDMGAYEFQGEPLSEPEQIVLIAPVDEAVDVALQPLFEWNAADGAETYDLVVSENDDFSDPVMSEDELTETEFQTGSDLVVSTTYYWRVRGVNPGGPGEWSDPFSFTTIGLPEAGDQRLMVSNASAYTFSGADFGVSNDGYSVKIIDLPDEGTLDYTGNAVSADDVIPVSQINTGELSWTPPEGRHGYGFTTLEFSVIDDNNLESEAYIMTLDLAATSVAFTGGTGWRFLTSPSQGDTFEDFLSPIIVQGVSGSNNPGAQDASLYILNQEEYQWELPGDMSEAINPGKGFIVFGFEDDVPATLTSGENWLPLDGSYEYEGLLFDDEQGEQGDSHFLLANPHPVSLDFCEFTKNLVADNIQIWDPAFNDGDYRTLSCANVGAEIAPFQAFWVRTMDDNPALGIPEEAYLKSTADGYFKEKDLSGFENLTGLSLRIESEDGAFTNDVQILFSEEGTTGLDARDAPKLSPQGLAPRWLSFYALDENQKPYAIRSLPLELARDQVTIPLGIETTQSGAYTLSWTLPGKDHFSGSYYLRDTQTGTLTELSEGQSYRFEIEESTVAKATNSPLKRGDERGVSATHRLADGSTPRFELTLSAQGLDELQDLPSQITLNQNYPNPFNPATIISYELPQQAHVRLDVYDMTGRHVAELVNEPMSAGIHQVSFNAMNLSSGVYMYRLQAGGVTLTRQLTLIK